MAIQEYRRGEGREGVDESVKEGRGRNKGRGGKGTGPLSFRTWLRPART